MRFVWPDSARSELWAIDRETAGRIVHEASGYFEREPMRLK
jgi:hypothetical protein